MPLGNILQKSDKALAAYLISTGAGTLDDVFPAKRSEEKESLPVTICECARAEVIGNPGSGVFEVDWCIYVRTAGISTEADNASEIPAANAGDRVARTVDAMNVNQNQSGEGTADAINAAASGVTDFKIQSAHITRLEAGFEMIGDAWCDKIEGKMIVTTNDATAS